MKHDCCDLCQTKNHHFHKGEFRTEPAVGEARPPVRVWAFVYKHELMDDRFTKVSLDNGMVEGARIKDFLVGTQVRVEMKPATEP